MKKINLLIIPALFCVFSLALAVPAMAVDPDTDTFWGGDGDIVDSVDVGDTIQLGSQDPRTIAANVINVILGFLGIVAVIIILAGGFKWMTAGGNQDKVDEARKLITAGVIGLVIILAAFGIATFVINALVKATGA